MQKKAGFAQAFELVSTRIDRFLGLPLLSMDQHRIKAEIGAIGTTPITDSTS